MGDRLWMGKPPWRKTKHPGLLSWTRPLWVGWIEYPTKAGGVNRHIAWHTGPNLWSCSVVLVPGWMDSRNQCRLTGSGSATMRYINPPLLLLHHTCKCQLVSQASVQQRWIQGKRIGTKPGYSGSALVWDIHSFSRFYLNSLVFSKRTSFTQKRFLKAKTIILIRG